jgi:predicted flap endonuclease-1-like 5' DNA nuclease
MLDPGGQAAAPFNALAAERLREAAALLAHQHDNPYRVAAYRRAADALDTDVRGLLEAGGVDALKQIPGVGERIAGGLAELARTVRWAYLERLRGSAEPRDVFCAIPGVGPVLARRLHETLHVETLEQLEAALHEGAKSVPGLGPRRRAALRAVLARPNAGAHPSNPHRTGRRASGRHFARCRLRVPSESTSRPVEEARPSASIQSAKRDCRSCTRNMVHGILRPCSPTPPARATRGPLAGQRVVRGREQECLSAYEHEPGPQRFGMNLGSPTQARH